MLRINPINLDCKKPKYKPTFAAEPSQQGAPQELANVMPYYNVKAPISYRKIEEVELPYNFKAHMYKLANGQRVVIVPKEGETVVKTYVNTGSMNEPDHLRGISHYIEHNLFNGSEGLKAGEFFETVNKMGAYTNASTGFSQTDYYISSNLLNDDDLENKIKIHASMLETPNFPTEMLEKEKGIINSEINMILGYPKNIIANATLKTLYNIKSSSEDMIGGTTANITALTREDVVNYYNNNYFPANMITVITGEVNPEDTMKLVSKYFSQNNKNTKEQHHEKLSPIQKTVRKDIISDKTPATHVMLGFNGPKNNDVKSQIYLDVLINLMTNPDSGRLTEELKQYNTTANFEVERVSSRLNDNKAILLSATTTEGNSEKVLKKIFEQISAIATNPPTDEELLSLKKTALQNYSFMFDFSDFLNSEIGANMLNGGIETISEYESIINSMTKEDIVRVAKEFLDLNKTAVTLLHPATATKESIEQNYAVSFCGSKNKQIINPDNIKRYRAGNNVEIITNNTKTNNVAFEINYTTENKQKYKPATAKLMAIMLREGTLYRDKSKFARDLQKDGISVKVLSGTSDIFISGHCSPEDLEKALKASKEVLQTPRLTQENLDYAKKELSNTLSISEKDVKDKLYKELFPDHNAGDTREEILDSIKDVTLEDIQELYKHIMNSAQANIVVSAPIDKNPELLAKLFNEASSLSPVQPTRPIYTDTFKKTKKTKVLTDIHDKNQAQIIEAFQFKDSVNIKDNATVNILNIILGGSASSRLFSDLREKQQLAYNVNSDIENVDNSGIFTLQIRTTTENKTNGEISYDNVQKSINGFNKHIERLKNEKVSEEELQKAKQYYKNKILSEAESNVIKNSMLADGLNSFYGPLKHNELLKVIDTITVEDIYKAANYIFSNKPTYSIIATKNTLEYNKEYLEKLSA